MADITQAQKAFSAGVLSLGIPLDGQQATKDLDYAKLAFRRASEWDPGMCDAWLGRIAAGDINAENLYQLKQTSEHTLYREQRRLGIVPRQLAGRFETGLYIDYPVANFAEIWSAYAAWLIKDGEYDEAEHTLKELSKKLAKLPRTEEHEIDEHVASYVYGVLYFKTQCWPDVMSALAGSATWDDKYMAAGAHLMVGTACAQLGLLTEASARLLKAEEGPIKSARAAAMLARGLCLREQGEEEEARSLFEKVYSLEPEFETNIKALNDPCYRLTITTREHIASRTNRWDPESAPSLQEKEEASDEKERDEQLSTAQELLDEQIGLDSVKHQVAKLRATATLAKIRAEKGLATSSRSLHLAFTGPPGTGKTTIARIIAKIYRGLGILSTDKVVEVKRQDFVGQYIGSTALKTTELIDSAMDGVLFIDEAYTLIQEGLSGGDAFGREAVDTLLARMEDDRARLVVIIAGYDAEIDRFLASNEGLASRFSRRLRFDSYRPEELGAIAKLIAQKRDSRLTPAAHDLLITSCQHLYDQKEVTNNGALLRKIDLAGNARFIRNIIELAEEEREFRLSSITEAGESDLDEEALSRIEDEDIRSALDSIIG